MKLVWITLPPHRYGIAHLSVFDTEEDAMQFWKAYAELYSPHREVEDDFE